MPPRIPQSARMVLLSKRITFNDATIRLGTARKNWYPILGGIHVITAFDGGGAKTIEVGRSGDTNSIITEQGVGTTGEVFNGAPDGAEKGANTVGREILINYSGSSPTTGDAVVWLLLFHFAQS